MLNNVLDFIFIPSVLLFILKINKGDYEGEVVILGYPTAQQKAKEMIEDLVAGSSSYLSIGMSMLYVENITLAFL